MSGHTTRATRAVIGVYRFDPGTIGLPDLSPLTLDASKVTLRGDATLASDRYLFIRASENGRLADPGIGDVRIGYRVLGTGFEGTIFGRLSGGTIGPDADADGNRLYRLFAGRRDEAVAALHTEFRASRWGLRFSGWLVMWLGLLVLFSPVASLLRWVPVVGGLGTVLIFTTTLTVSFVLAGGTIIVSAVTDRVTILVVALALAIGAVIAVIMMPDRKAAGSR